MKSIGRRSTLKLNMSVAVTSSVALAVGLGVLAGADAAGPKAAGPKAARPAASASPLSSAKALMTKGSYQKAILEIDKYIAAHPESAEAQYLAGEASFKSGNAKKSARHLRAAVRLGKGSVYSQRANALMMKLPREITRPRTGPETRMLASMFGISTLRGDGGDARPTVIDFYASWCQPCKDMDRALEKAKQEYGEKITIMKVDIDDPKNDKLIEQYEVSPIPTVVFLNSEGEVVTYAIGYAENNVTDGLKKVLNPS